MTTDEQFMIECITTELVTYVMEDYHLGMQAALEEVYASDTYGKLTDTRTGLYYQSPLYVYDILKEELQQRGGQHSLRHGALPK